MDFEAVNNVMEEIYILHEFLDDDELEIGFNYFGLPTGGMWGEGKFGNCLFQSEKFSKITALANQPMTFFFSAL